MRLVKNDIKEWNKNCFGDIGEKLRKTKNHLEQSQLNLLSDPTKTNFQIELEAKVDYQAATVDQEVLVTQKSRILWLKDNDRCTEVITPVKKLKVKEVKAFDKMVSAEEIKGVMGFNPDKSAGPDGFPTRFFQKIWSIVGMDVIAVVQSFFSTSVMPIGVSSCFFTLIPKVGNAKKLGRRIQDALILAHAMVKDFKGPNHASMALKMDIKKAYDSVS
ncbi:uncharacterized protein LOC132309085 [Cornus florida]|uniref:uncharacterized protein LOC132309085 n=1 Tax=Cornus florida TaxID=4283 RepID=UPI002897733B|nr:uncharacterized protein LOC132309085 [Cornus florida]